MHDFESSPLYGLMHPKSVAFWGASNNPMGMGSVQMSQLIAMGFDGPLYPIHPKEKVVMGRPAYSSIDMAPGRPDLAVIVLPTQVVPEILEQCGRAGVKNAIVVSAGFGEMGNHGKELQQRIVDIALQFGIFLVGPNCIGVVNPYAKLNTTFLPYDGKPGFVGMASQSGSFVTQMFDYLDDFGLGFSQAISVGNEALTDITDCLEYLGACPRTKVVALYIETIRRGPEFLRVARRVTKTKPIVAFYVGGSSAGGKAAMSHTGALAGSDPLYDGLFNQAGILRAWSIEEMFDFCLVLGTQPLPKGNRIAVLTHSGGPGAAAADAADRAGLRLADLSERTIERLRRVVPHTASVSNPVDLTFNRTPADYVQVLPEILLDDANVDMLFIYLLLPLHRVRKAIMSMTHDADKAEEMAGKFLEEQTAALSTLAPSSGKPVAGASFSPRAERFIRMLQDKGVPALPSPERAVRALGALAKYAAFRERVT